MDPSRPSDTCGNWTVKERDAEGEWVVRDLVIEFMRKIRLGGCVFNFVFVSFRFVHAYVPAPSGGRGLRHSFHGMRMLISKK